VFIKLTRSGQNRYVQLVEAYRDATTGRSKQRTVAILGRLDQLNTELKSVISGLQRVTGQPTAVAAPSGVSPTLGFDRLRTVFRHTRHSIDVEALTRVMVFNRLCDPDSKLGVLRWLDPIAALSSITQEHTEILQALTTKNRPFPPS
jgi:hypothetical protein